MACPFFMPTERLLEGGWLHPSRLPLGAGWNGCCCVPGYEDSDLPAGVLHECCNMGYAFTCPRLPRERQFDSVRFAVAQDRGSRIILHYACERNHRPVTHGKLEYDVSSATWLRHHEDGRIQKMIDCYLQSYLLRRIQPASPGLNASA